MRMLDSVEMRHLFDMHVDLEPAQVSWLNSVVAVAVHGLGPEHVDYRAFEVL